MAGTAAGAGGAGRLIVPLLKPEGLARFVAHRKRGNSAACVLGLDVGGSKVGLALSDRTLAFAQPLGRVDRRADRPFVEFPRQVARRLGELVKEHHVGGLVVGYPLELWTGQPGQRCKEVFRFMEQVYKQVDLLNDGTEGSKNPTAPVSLPPFALWDERMTTQEAREALASAGRTRKGRQAAAEDEVAATIILQGFLDAHVMTYKPRPPGQ